MSPLDGLNLLLRWTHLIAGIAWIGSSFYFIWLDRSLEKPREGRDPGVEGSLWMTHSGGFYRVERRAVGPGRMPERLHWFKWEAAITWITGLSLLVVVYYLTGGLYLKESAREGLPLWAAIGLGLGTIAVGWKAYDTLWLWAEERHQRAALVISILLLAAAVLLLTRFLSGRAAYLHVGALLGTIMAANVWERILPAQSRMIRATERGQEPDGLDSRKAKRRSVHNTYLTFPVLFLMLSAHYPEIWGHAARALLLLLLVVAGMSARHLMLARGTARYASAGALAASLVVLVAMLMPVRPTASPAPLAGTEALGDSVPDFAAVQAIVLSRCTPCHSQQPRLATFGAAPAGVSFDDPAEIRRLAKRIHVRTVETRTMPLGNLTAMTLEERELLRRWVAAGGSDRRNGP